MRFTLTLCFLALFPVTLPAAFPDVEELYRDSHAAVFQLVDLPEETPRGSGFLAGPDGLAVTNAHVLRGAEELQARFPGGKKRAIEVLAKDRGTDLGLLRIPDVDREPLVLSPREIRTGEAVFSVASPHGFVNSLSVGHVSAVDRQFPDEPVIPYLQVELGVHPGSSGGPVLNDAGEVVGVLTQVVAGEDGRVALSFALPSWLVVRVLGHLTPDDGREPGWLGLELEAGPTHLKVDGLAAGGPAEQAGLDREDRLLPLGGVPVSRARFQSELLRPDAGQPVTVLRISESEVALLTLWPQPVSEIYRNLPVQGARVRPAASVEPKVEVVEANAGGVLEPGDRLSRMGSERLLSPEMLDSELQNAGDEGVAVLIHRDGDRFYEVLRPEDE